MVQAERAHPQPAFPVASVSPGHLDVPDVVRDSLAGVELAYRTYAALFSETSRRPGSFVVQ